METSITALPWIASLAVAVSATADWNEAREFTASAAVADSAIETSIGPVVPLIAENGAAENGSKPNTLLPYMSCAVVRLETWDVVRTSGIVMGISSEGEVCHALSTQALSAWFQFHCHPALSAGLGSLMIHSQFSHTRFLPSGMSVGGEGAGCHPSVPSVSVLGIDPFFVQYFMV
jgi:hypothetical protein